MKRLREGNQRFVAGTPNEILACPVASRTNLVAGQDPFAVILGCSDSRVPLELVFDQGLGDLFVIRVAGNIVAPSQIGSIEFAVEQFRTRLIVVLGHSGCGAVAATVDQLKQPEENRSPNLSSIVNRIRPAVDALGPEAATLDRDALIEKTVRSNVSASIRDLQSGSSIIRDIMENDHLRIVGAEYSLKTGEVDFFENAPDESSYAEG
ncbi:carbonic anhydrase [Verrucomicrobiales bacterium BCK34]|nr:carbonic anhydrase [Verrucomicrobiales bacterium BCK34]